MEHRRHIALSILLAACDAAVPADPMMMMDPPPPPPPPPPVVEDIVEVPLDLERLSTTASCTALLEGERTLGVSPEGHLWTASGATTIRVLDGWSGDVSSFDLRINRIDSVRVWSSTSASMVADGSLFAIRDRSRVSVSSPLPIAAGAQVCGDLSSRAFVLSGGRMIERVDDEWIEWSGLDTVLTSSTAFLPRDGACWGHDDQVWLSTGAELWRMGPASITRSDLADPQHAVLSGDRVLALAEGLLYLGPGSWKRWSFAAGGPSLLASGGSYAWLVAGDALFRFDGERFLEVDFDGEPIALHPHASGGIWIETIDQVCHLSPVTMVRVAGLVSGEQRSETTLRLRAQAGGTEVTAALDGQAIEPIAVDGDWFVFQSELALGWRELSLSAGETKRALAVKGLPSIERSFEADIRPIYEANCTGATCHIQGNSVGAPDFSRYEVWVMRAEKVRERIVERQDMPPLAVRSPDWGEAQIQIINEWLSGGLRP